MDVENFRIGPVGQQPVADGVHQVGFAQTDATVDEQRVVKVPWHARNMHGCGPCHAVGGALNQGVKSQRGVESVFQAVGQTVFASIHRRFGCAVFDYFLRRMRFDSNFPRSEC